MIKRLQIKTSTQASRCSSRGIATRKHFIMFGLIIVFGALPIIPPSNLIAQVVYYDSEPITFEPTDQLSYTPLFQVKGINTNCIYKASDNLLYLGTDNGLIVHNGYTYEKAFPDQELSALLQSLKINAIDETKEKLLLATNKGFYTIDKSTDKITRHNISITESDPLNTRAIADIIVADNNTIWIAIEHYGIAHFATLKSKPVFYQYESTSNSSLASNDICKLAQDKNSILWAISRNGYLNRFDITKNTFENQLIHSPETNDPFDVIDFIDFNDHLWIGTASNGLYTFNILTEELKHYQYDSLHPNLSNRINGFCETDHGLWISFSGQSLCVTTDGVDELTALDNIELLPAKSITSLTSFENEVWVSTLDGHTGFLHKQPELLNPIYKPSKSHASPVTSMHQERFNRLWSGTLNGEILLLDQSSTLLNVSLINDSISNHPEYAIQDIAIDELGNLWLATANRGLFLFDPIGEQVLKEYNRSLGDSILASNHVECILYLWEGRLLFGTDKGIYTCNSENDSISPVMFNSDEKDFNQPAIHDLFLNDDESIWAATSDGIWRQNRRNTGFEQVEKLILGNRKYFEIIKDSSGVFWLSSSNSILRFNPRNANTDEYPLPFRFNNSKIRSLSTIDHQRFAVITNEACLVFNTESKTYIDISPTFNHAENRTFYHSILKERNQTIISSSEGLYSLSGSSNIFEENPPPPSPNVYALFIKNKRVVPGQKVFGKRILKRNIVNTHRIVLNRRTRDLRIQMTIPGYFKSQNVSLAYQLAGLNTGWQYTTGNQINFDNLPYGRYTLKCVTINNRLSQSEPYVLKIKVRRPVFITWWFLTAILAALFYYAIKILNQSRDNARGKYRELERQLTAEKASLTEKSNLLQKEREAFVKREEEEQVLRFHSNGLAQFSSSLSKNQDNVEQLAQVLITELVEFIEAHQGVVYVVNDDDPNHIFLEPKGSFAADTESLMPFLPSEGYVGTAYKEKRVINLSDVPDSYIHVSSGLGNETPKHIQFVPIMQNELCLGVIELSSFDPIADYKREFIVKLAENIGSTLAISKGNSAINRMLDISRQQAEELKSSEEEMRQNMEEMQATQEDLRRQMEQNKEMRDSLIKEKALLDAIMNWLPDYIYFKDWDCKFLRISQSMLKLFPVDSLDEMIGKSDFDFQPREVAQQYYNDEQKIMKSGNALLNDIQHEVFDNGMEQWVSTTKMPFYDERGNCVGIFGITKDITDIKKMEIDTKEQNARLLEQEEELRQNLEEMQATQDDLRDKMEENMRMQQSLEKENALLDAIMNNLPEYIYFKDKESKFIRISQSMLKLFPVETLEEMVGKSDFDFQPRESAQKYYDDEQKIMKTGKGVFDDIAHEVMQNGLEQWVSTTKMPFYNDKGECIGTFGITKDITSVKQLEIEAKQQAEELREHEEELRQNLEEMQATQDDLHEKIEENLRMQQSLEKENALLDAIMNNLPEYIYFKDKDSKFIRISQSMLKLFPVETLEEMVGKSDFDFQPRETAQKYYEDELQIIESGRGVFDDISHEVMQNGLEQWVTTTKLPFYNDKGECIGTFGITKDITKIKLLEIEANEQAEELREHEEELRQNLEELQAIQEELGHKAQLHAEEIAAHQKREQELLNEIDRLKKQKN